MHSSRIKNLSVLCWAIVLPLINAQNKTGYDYVDPLIGTINGGELRRRTILVGIDKNRPRLSWGDTTFW